MCFDRKFLQVVIFLLIGIARLFATDLLYIELWTECAPVSITKAESELPPTTAKAASNLNDLWKTIDPIPVAEDQSILPISQEQAFINILAEARTLLSTMIYGVTFTYIPADTAHGVAEYFQMTPIAEIKWGDKNLHVESTERAENRIYIRISYLLEEFQQKRRDSWSSIRIPAASGTGFGAMIKGMKEKRTALGMSLKDAVRNMLHTRIINKPHEIRGSAILDKNPSTIVREGRYTTTARFKIMISEVIPYKIF